MPYSKKRYGSRAKYRKYRSCVRQVGKKSRGVNPYAVCRSSVYGKGGGKSKVSVRKHRRHKALSGGRRSPEPCPSCGSRNVYVHRNGYEWTCRNCRDRGYMM